MYKVSVVFKLLDATHETLKNRIGEQETSESYIWAESEEDAVGQCMADALNDQTNPKITSISENKLVFLVERPISWTEPDKSVNTVEISYSATPIQ